MREKCITPADPRAATRRLRQQQEQRQLEQRRQHEMAVQRAAKRLQQQQETERWRRQQQEQREQRELEQRRQQEMAMQRPQQMAMQRQQRQQEDGGSDESDGWNCPDEAESDAEAEWMDRRISAEVKEWLVEQIDAIEACPAFDLNRQRTIVGNHRKLLALEQAAIAKARALDSPSAEYLTYLEHECSKAGEQLCESQCELDRLEQLPVLSGTRAPAR